MNERKKERRRILRRIDLLEPRRCSNCAEGSASKAAVLQCQCEAAVEIRELGKQYLGLTQEAKAERVERLLKQMDESGLDWALYRQMKEDEVMDKVIFHRLGMSSAKFYEWKKLNGEESK